MSLFWRSWPFPLLARARFGISNLKKLRRIGPWSSVSQVIPVYPLSEDLQPGDVLLVGMPIEDQVKMYEEKGFLPLDQHFVRLYSMDFKDFYNSRYGIDNNNIPPSKWQTVNSEGKHNWESAPHAAFPTYQFSVETGSGLNLAIPIQGVPFALGLHEFRQGEWYGNYR